MFTYLNEDTHKTHILLMLLCLSHLRRQKHVSKSSIDYISTNIHSNILSTWMLQNIDSSDGI